MKPFLVIALVAAGLVLMVPLGSFVYEAGGPDACARCHEIGPQVEKWQVSTHRSVTCDRCHGNAMTMEARFHLTNLRRLRAHIRDEAPERPHLKIDDVLRMQAQCQECHQEQFAAWRNGPHSVSYESIFLDQKHNSERLMMDDCLRCHAMHFDGPVKDLVSPISTQGPWKLLRQDLKNSPAIPCLTCHSVHREGQPLRGHVRKAMISRKEEIVRPSVGMYDRRTQAGIAAAMLPLPQTMDGERKIRMSPDRRQSLCYQCHAPWTASLVGTGDDRTPMGVHEGISCLACHDPHMQTTRASCATCHPKMSNCNRDAEAMDTTFSNKESKHNIHWVKCADCHPKGIPARKAKSAAD
jgi:hypothetical protein